MRRRLLWSGLAAALLGGAASLYGWIVNGDQAAHSWLAAYAFALSVTIGMLFLLLIGNAADATWFVPLRRLTESVVAVIPMLAVLLVPVLVSMDVLYPWSGPLHDVEALDHHGRELVSKKEMWLNRPFFLGRAAIWLVGFLAISEPLLRWSHRQDREDGDPERLRRRMIALSAGGLPILALLLTMATFDWIMSIQPVWFSNILGVYLFAGGFWAALAVVALLMVAARSTERLPAAVGAEHGHAVGRLLLAFTIFWTYIGFCQLMLIWIADLPEEVIFYLDRWEGGWEWYGVGMIVGHFVVPFALLLSQRLKRHPRALAAVAAWVLINHYADMYWLVLPALHPRLLAPHWLDAATLLTVVGACLAFGAWRAGERSLVPVRDPRLSAGLAYEAESA